MIDIVPELREADLYLGVGEPGLAYVPVWQWQQSRARAVASGQLPEAIALLEHAPVYTLGRASDPSNLLRDPDEYRARGATVEAIDRGGDATWHGPGQITGYPILDLTRRGRDIHRYVWTLEECLIDLAAQYGIEATRAAGRPGIWVGNDKLAAIGVKVTRWVTYHGVGLNVTPDLGWFDHIVPCGLHGFGVTSMAALLGRSMSVAEVADRLSVCFADRFALVLSPPKLLASVVDTTTRSTMMVSAPR